MSALHQTLETIAANVAQQIIEALRGASIDDFVGAAGGGNAPRVRTEAPPKNAGPVRRKVSAGRLGRRSTRDIHQTLAQIVSLLGNHPNGLRAEEIKASLGLDRREMPRPIAEGLSTGALSKSGQKRATTYTTRSASSQTTTAAPAKKRRRT